MPEVDVVLERVEPWPQTVRLLANEIDFAIGPSPVDGAKGGFWTTCLAERAISVVLSSKHPLAGRESLCAEDLSNERFIEFADSEAEGYAVVSRLLGLTP